MSRSPLPGIFDESGTGRNWLLGQALQREVLIDIRLNIVNDMVDARGIFLPQIASSAVVCLRISHSYLSQTLMTKPAQYMVAGNLA